MESVAKVYMKHSVESGIFIFFIYMIARACLSVCFTAIEQTSNFSSITNAATVLLGWFWINHILHCLWKSYITNDFTKSMCSKTLMFMNYLIVFTSHMILKKWFDLISETLLKSFLSYYFTLQTSTSVSFLHHRASKAVSIPKDRLTVPADLAIF